jgi:hypothetical protein
MPDKAGMNRNGYVMTGDGRTLIKGANPDADSLASAAIVPAHTLFHPTLFEEFGLQYQPIRSISVVSIDRTYKLKMASERSNVSSDLVWQITRTWNPP